jgi:exonuclease III
MKIITWNLYSRTNLETLNNQCNYLKNQNLDVITLQEVTPNSQDFFKDYFKKF